MLNGIGILIHRICVAAQKRKEKEIEKKPLKNEKTKQSQFNLLMLEYKNN